MKKSNTTVKKITLFDHVKHIRQIQSPKYYITLSEEDKKTFNHFMILRALSMDSSIVDGIAQLYRICDLIPSAQFYTLLISIIPKNYYFYPWIKSRKFKHNKELLKLVANRFKVSTYQANDYINLLLRIDNGTDELMNICKSYGLTDKEIEKIIEIKKDNDES